MAVGRISGPLLKSNLLRNGVDLAFETDLLYLDVNNSRVGIKTTSPQHPLDVNGSARITDLDILTPNLPIGNLTIDGTTNTISTTANSLNIGTPNAVVYQNKIVVDNITLDGNVIQATNVNGNLEFRPQGTGTVNFFGDTNITGNLHATGNISADGNITIGDADTDTLTINADIAGDLIPDVTNTYDIGTPTKRWKHGYINNLNTTTLNSSSITLSGIDLVSTPGNLYYVGTSGDDTKTGNHPQDPYATVAKALSVATAGDTVYIYPGTYQEVFPLTIPAGVAVKGTGLRSVKITPTAGTNTNDAIYLNGESTIEDLTIGDFYYDSINDTGYAFKFANNMTVTSRSPYIRNVTVLTKGSVTSASDPRGFDQGDAGRGAFLDGSVVNSSSREAGCLFHAVTFITPAANALHIKNGTRIEWLNSFTYFADKGILAENGTTGLYGAGKTKVKLREVSGTFTAGQSFSYFEGGTLRASGTIASNDGAYVFLTGNIANLIEAGARVGKSVTANGNAQIDTAIKKFGQGSALLDGTDDYLSIASNDDFGFGTGDFAVEGWIYCTNISGNRTLFDFRGGADGDTAPTVEINGSGAVRYLVGGVQQITGGTVVVNTWHHVAVSRLSGVTRLFLDGSKIGSDYTDTNNYGTTKPLTIGASHDGTEDFVGHFDDIRVSTISRYSGNFTPPTSEVANDEYVKLVLRFNETDGSTTFTDDGIYEQDIRCGNGATAKFMDLVDYTDFGGEIRSIASACIYGNYGAYGNGNGVTMYLIGTNFAYIGLGKEVDNDPTQVIQAQETTELNGARVYFNSVDHKGDFRVGDLFHVDQQTGTVNFTNANFNIDTTTGVTFTDGSSTTNIDGSKIQTGNVKLSSNIVESLSGDLIIDASGKVNFNDDVNITGNLDVSGDLTIGGNITIGDAASDTIQITAGIESDLVPSVDGIYNLGSATKQWSNLYTGRLNVDSIAIDDNYITTTDSNADLQLRANGTGDVVIDDLRFNTNTIRNISGDMILNPASETVHFDSTGSIRLPAGTTAERPGTPVVGMVRYNTDTNVFEGYDGNWIALNGLYDLDQDTYISPEATPGTDDDTLKFYAGGTLVASATKDRFDIPKLSVDDIEITGDTITTTVTNGDLNLVANGTGGVNVENFSFNANTITNNVSGGVTTLAQTGTGYFKIEGAGGFVIPTGDNFNRHPTPVLGMMRFNTADDRVEIYDASNNWVSVAGSSGAVSALDAENIAIQTAIIMG